MNTSERNTLIWSAFLELKKNSREERNLTWVEDKQRWDIATTVWNANNEYFVWGLQSKHTCENCGYNQITYLWNTELSAYNSKRCTSIEDGKLQAEAHYQQRPQND